MIKKTSLLLIIAGVLFVSTTAYCQPRGAMQRKQGDRPRQGERPRHVEKTPAELSSAVITITIGGADGSIKPLLGVNAGPVPSGDKGNADVTAAYMDCGVNMVRTHDFYGPMDLAAVYPDINADPLSQASYNFSASDNVFTAIAGSEFEPYIRLGDSYNNVRIPANDQQRKNLVQAGCEFIRHYRRGSLKEEPNSGFRYVEIWNEPDNKKFWPAGFEDFLPYFAQSFSALKLEFPNLKIGGPGFVVASYKIPQARKNVGDFLTYLKERGIKLDFLSYHIYSNDPSEYYDSALFYRQALERAGFTGCELHITEWNSESERSGIEFRVGEKAAPYLTAHWIALQQAGVDVACFYRGTDTSINMPTFFGMFYADGREKPAAKAFKLWKAFSECNTRLTIKTGIDLLDSAPKVYAELKPLWILAGKGAETGTMLLVSNIGDKAISYTVQRQNSNPIRSISVTEINSPKANVASYSSDKPTLSIGPLTVQLLKIE
jgi:hypothetical protein